MKSIYFTAKYLLCVFLNKSLRIRYDLHRVPQTKEAGCVITTMHSSVSSAIGICVYPLAVFLTNTPFFSFVVVE